MPRFRRERRNKTGWDQIPGPLVDDRGIPVVDKGLEVEARIKVDYMETPYAGEKPGWRVEVTTWHGTTQKTKASAGYRTKEDAKDAGETIARALGDEIRKILSDRLAGETFRITV